MNPIKPNRTKPIKAKIPPTMLDKYKKDFFFVF